MPKIKNIVFDLSRTLLFPQNPAYTAELNALHRELVYQHGHAYDASQYYFFNAGLFDFIFTQIPPTVGTYIFTTGEVQDHVSLQPTLSRFKHVFTASEIGYMKTNPHAYRVLADKIGCRPEEIVFVDDSAANIRAANHAHINTILYTDDQFAIYALKQMLLES